MISHSVFVSSGLLERPTKNVENHSSLQPVILWLTAVHHTDEKCLFIWFGDRLLDRVDAANVLFMSNDHQQLMHLLKQHVNISQTTQQYECDCATVGLFTFLNLSVLTQRFALDLKGWGWAKVPHSVRSGSPPNRRQQKETSKKKNLKCFLKVSSLFHRVCSSLIQLGL